jgi:hypothetical protein
LTLFGGASRLDLVLNIASTTHAHHTHARHLAPSRVMLRSTEVR